ncbi:MAG: hypothetical protein M3367_09305, partial [Acidobacteriota bacterium]|nr:hypothetical protein [Acidobacteriota bacterium]
YSKRVPIAVAQPTPITLSLTSKTSIAEFVVKLLPLAPSSKAACNQRASIMPKMFQLLFAKIYFSFFSSLLFNSAETFSSGLMRVIIR